MSDPIDKLTTKIIEFHEHLLSWEQDVIRKSGLSSTQTHIVDYLGDNQPIKMAEIARRMGITTGSLTVAVDHLQQKGFVRRQMQPDDRRSYRILLTENGKHLFEQHRRFHRTLTVTGSNGFTEQELQQFTDMLERFTANL